MRISDGSSDVCSSDLNMWRGTAVRRQAAALHQVLLDLSYPTPEAERRVSALSGSLRRHAREMEEAAQVATNQIASLCDTMSGQQQSLLAAASISGDTVSVRMSPRLNSLPYFSSL